MGLTEHDDMVGALSADGSDARIRFRKQIPYDVSMYLDLGADSEVRCLS
jgi:hypothetical protein